MSVHIEGMDDLVDSLDNISGETEVPMNELFTEGFMKSNTEFNSFDEFLEKSPWSVETQEDFKQIPEDEFDEYVREHTGFNSWEAMMTAAGREWVTRQLDS